MSIKLQKRKDIVMHSQDTFRCKAPTYEVLEAMKELNETEFKLLMYYYSKSTGWKFDDAQIASTIGVTPRTLVIAKHSLIDKEYLYIMKHKEADTYFVGKRAVREWKYPPEDEVELAEDN